MCSLGFECKIDQTDFTNWMSVLQSDLMQKMSSNPEPLSTNT